MFDLDLLLSNLKFLTQWICDFSWCFYFLPQVLLSVDVVNSYIAWDFSLVQGKINMVSLLCCYTLISKCYDIFQTPYVMIFLLFICQDIGFSLEFVSPTGEKTVSLDGVSLLFLYIFSIGFLQKHFPYCFSSSPIFAFKFVGPHPAHFHLFLFSCFFFLFHDVCISISLFYDDWFIITHDQLMLPSRRYESDQVSLSHCCSLYN